MASRISRPYAPFGPLKGADMPSRIALAEMPTSAFETAGHARQREAARAFRAALAFMAVSFDEVDAKLRREARREQALSRGYSRTPAIAPVALVGENP